LERLVAVSAALLREDELAMGFEPRSEDTILLILVLDVPWLQLLQTPRAKEVVDLIKLHLLLFKLLFLLALLHRFLVLLVEKLMQVVDGKNRFDLVGIDVGILLQSFLNDVFIDLIEYLIEKVATLRDVVDALGALYLGDPSLVFADPDLDRRLVTLVHHLRGELDERVIMPVVLEERVHVCSLLPRRGLLRFVDALLAYLHQTISLQASLADVVRQHAHADAVAKVAHLVTSIRTFFLFDAAYFIELIPFPALLELADDR
jgi:hypothetical protein